ncbi:MAG: ATP-binding cassette domain-containing protein [Deltaproteobacteria bacterium]|nr:ATP-binding cassette domain-containing protein [Deltaproteobacteria bacterium]
MDNVSLHFSAGRKLDFFDLDISFSCNAGKILVLIGPSGGGKTTIVRLLAGLEKPDRGAITFGDEVWFDSARGIHLPPRKRRLGYVFQDYSLFPHLTLFENAAFAAVDHREVDELLDLFGIAHLRDRKPHQVSGGERQRCAICQSLARHPRLLLLDEPLSALDVVTRRELREELKNLKARISFPIVYVTHDINEALFLADAILPVVNGRADDQWMHRAAGGESSNLSPSRAARTTRLALAY